MVKTCLCNKATKPIEDLPQGLSVARAEAGPHHSPKLGASLSPPNGETGCCYTGEGAFPGYNCYGGPTPAPDPVRAKRRHGMQGPGAGITGVSPRGILC